MLLENEYAVKSIQASAIFSLNEHEMKKSKISPILSASQLASSSSSSSSLSNMMLTSKTRLLVENLFEMNKKVSDFVLELVFFSNSIRNFSIKQILVEIFPRK